VVSRLIHAPPPLAACGFTRRWKKRQGRSAKASSPLHCPAGGGFHRDLQQGKKRRQLILNFLFLVHGSVFFLFFSVLDLLPSTDLFFSFPFPFFSVSGGGKTKGAAGC
jgi:hypothetical protein